MVFFCQSACSSVPYAEVKTSVHYIRVIGGVVNSMALDTVMLQRRAPLLSLDQSRVSCPPEINNLRIHSPSFFVCSHFKRNDYISKQEVFISSSFCPVTAEITLYHSLQMGQCDIF